MELKTVNLISTKGEMRRNLGVTTCHHLNYDIIKRYRNVSSWLVGIFHINEPARIYEIETEKLEPYFQKWEKQLDEKRGKGERKPHLNNPKIGVRHIIEHGTVVYENCDFDTYFETKSKGKEKMDKDYVISLLEQKGYRQKNILEEHLIPMWNGEKKVVVVLVTEDLTKENMFYLLNEVKKETNEFYILAESEKVLYLKAKREFLMWINEKIGGINKAQGKIKANFSTIEKIASSKQIWEHLIF